MSISWDSAIPILRVRIGACEHPGKVNADAPHTIMCLGCLKYLNYCHRHHVPMIKGKGVCHECRKSLEAMMA